MKRRYFGTDGIRGTVGQFPITPEFCLHLGWAAGRVFTRQGDCHVIIGKDTRVSGYMLESVMESGLVSAGADVSLVGPMPTPAIAYLTRTLRADAGIVISASHNAYQDNGIKFFDANGAKLDDAVELEIEAELSKQMVCAQSNRLGKAARVGDAPGRYIEFCKATVSRGFRLQGLRLVLDCAHGATYHVAPGVFEELGADISVIGDSPNGFNINAGCGSTEPAALVQAVRQRGADVGIGFDGDGDRVILVDHQGAVVDGDDLLYIIACHRHRSGALRGGVAGTAMTNFGLERALGELGIPFERAKVGDQYAVGDRYVMELMQRRGWELGGESSGHILCLDLSTTGDGIIAALQALVPMVEEGQSIHQLKQGITKLPQVTLNVQVKEASATLACGKVAGAVDAGKRQLDGHGRVLIRPSGTEPVIRVMVEGEDQSEVSSIAEELAAAVSRAV